MDSPLTLLATSDLESCLNKTRFGSGKLRLEFANFFINRKKNRLNSDEVMDAPLTCKVREVVIHQLVMVHGPKNHDHTTDKSTNLITSCLSSFKFYKPESGKNALRQHQWWVLVFPKDTWQEWHTAESYLRFVAFSYGDVWPAADQNILHTIRQVMMHLGLDMSHERTALRLNWWQELSRNQSPFLLVSGATIRRRISGDVTTAFAVTSLRFILLSIYGCTMFPPVNFWSSIKDQSFSSKPGVAAPSVLCRLAHERRPALLPSGRKTLPRISSINLSNNRSHELVHLERKHPQAWMDAHDVPWNADLGESIPS